MVAVISCRKINADTEKLANKISKQNTIVTENKLTFSDRVVLPLDKSIMKMLSFLPTGSNVITIVDPHWCTYYFDGYVYLLSYHTGVNGNYSITNTLQY